MSTKNEIRASLSYFGKSGGCSECLYLTVGITVGFAIAISGALGGLNLGYFFGAGDISGFPEFVAKDLCIRSMCVDVNL